jgi:hypothetical protein
MKNSIFVSVNSDSIKIISENLSISTNYSEKGIHNVNPEITALLIKECLVENSLLACSIILVPSSEYVVITEKIITATKTTAKQETEFVKITLNILRSENLKKSLIFSKNVSYICNGKTYSNYDSLPLLNKYFTNYTSLEFDPVFIPALLTNLEKNDIDVNAIVTYDNLISDIYEADSNSKRQILLSFLDNKCTASVSENGRIRYNIAYNCGINKIMENISNTFNISMQTATKLASSYGFTFLPKEYLNCVIDVPVYGTIVQSIGLPELTYCIRESLKELFTGVINSLSAKMSDYEINSVFVCDYACNIRGVETLLELMLNTDIKFTSIDRYEYSILHNNYNRLFKVDIEDRKVVPTQPIIIPVETNDSPALFDRLSNIFNSKIKPLLLEQEM